MLSLAVCIRQTKRLPRLAFLGPGRLRAAEAVSIGAPVSKREVHPPEHSGQLVISGSIVHDIDQVAASALSWVDPRRDATVIIIVLGAGMQGTLFALAALGNSGSALIAGAVSVVNHLVSWQISILVFPVVYWMYRSYRTYL